MYIIKNNNYCFYAISHKVCGLVYILNMHEHPKMHMHDTDTNHNLKK